jgi:hypothetical protein
MIDEQDKDILDRLQRYQPFGPPSNLRELVLGTTPDAGESSARVAWQLATVAAVLAVGVAFQVLRARVERDWSADLTSEAVDFSYPADVAAALRLPRIEETVEDSTETPPGWEQ